MSTVPKPLLTPAEYLQRERAAEFRSEFYRGEMFAMAGASLAHTQIKDNFAAEIRSQLKGGKCRVATADLRVKVDATGLYTYPDLVIYCGEPQLEDDVLDTLLNPTVIIEVLSESTERYDRGAKFVQYRKLPSLLEYVLISQDHAQIERFVRQSDESWLLTAFDGLPSTFSFATVPVQVPLVEIYRDVKFPPAKPPQQHESP